MSIDFMVFDPASAPRSPSAFRAWYFAQTDWSESDEVFDPSIATPAIQSWYRQMTARFPDSNRPAVDAEAVDETYGDYNFTRHVCYVAFASSAADEAWATILELAAEEGLGTYDPNSDDERSNDCIRFPDGPLGPNAPQKGGIFSLFGKKT